jgi:SH3-like domain-containing protein
LGIVFLLVGVLSYVLLFHKPVSKGVSELSPDGRLPLPRFASFRSEEVNVRVGPGSNYPILWIYRRMAFPVQITAEFDTWRKVKDFEGVEGWVNKNMLSSKRHIVVTAKTTHLRSSPNINSSPKAILEQGSIAQLIDIQEPWCHVKVAGLKGWMMIHEAWGVFHTTKKEKSNVTRPPNPSRY